MHVPDDPISAPLAKVDHILYCAHAPAKSGPGSGGLPQKILTMKRLDIVQFVLSILFEHLFLR